MPHRSVGRRPKILQRLIGDHVQLARSRVREELPIPDLGIEFGQPGTQFLKFIRRQGLDPDFEFFPRLRNTSSQFMPNREFHPTAYQAVARLSSHAARVFPLASAKRARRASPNRPNSR